VVREIIFDANFLFIPFQFRIDIFSKMGDLINNYEPIVLSTTIDELEGLTKNKLLKVRKQSLAALDLTKKCKVVNVVKKREESFDDTILRVAKEWNWMVATNDRILRKRLRKANISTIFLRQRSYLQIEGILY
jgi:rRNA-processing protein FCF1